MATEENILITGSGGQIGSLLADGLSEIYGKDHIIMSDIKELRTPYRFVRLDVTDAVKMEKIIKDEKVTQIYHLAAILSATGEKDPLRTWDINMGSLLNVLQLSVENNIKKVFYPSSIAAFGPNIDLTNVTQNVNLSPTTVYGISKSSGELWANYYFGRYGLDVRSLRYPGLISYQTPPGGGTTDYAVDIFHQAKKHGKFTCFLDKDTTLPMMYMDDAIRATIELMEAEADKVKIRTSYNLAAFSFSPQELADQIRKHIPDFEITYEPDFRQKIAEGWPQVIDDTEARKDWGWKPEYSVGQLVEVMLENV